MGFALVLAFAHSAAPAQSTSFQFVEASTNAVLGDGPLPSARSVSTGNFNADGRPDLLLNAQELFLSRDGGFDRAASPPAASAIGELAVDLDGDGATDVVQAQPAGMLRLLWNNGAGGFTAAQLETRLPNLADLDAVDLDGDGALELVALHGNRVVLLRQTAGRRFIDRSAGNVPLGLTLHKLTFGDLDGDGDADAVAHTGVVLLGNGALRLTQSTATGLGQGTNGGLSAFVTDGGPLLGDLDGDRRLDVVIGRKAYLRRGTGYTLAGAVPGHLGTRLIGLVDCDRDGDRDVVVAGSLTNANSSCAYFRNDGRGRFPAQSIVEIPDGGTPMSGGVIGDWNLDGAADLALVGPNRSAPLHIVLQRHNGIFDSVASRRWDPEDRHGVAGIADLDGDTFLDVVTLPSSVFLNDGLGAFSDRQVTFRIAHGSVGDLTGDGSPDVIETEIASTPRFRVRPNDGSGRFPAATAWAWNYVRLDSATLFDADGDGDLDVVQLGAASGPALWRNDRGRSLAAAPGAITTTGNPQQLTPGDFDGDGDLDLVAAQGAGLHLLRNNSRGNFRRVAAAFPTLTSARDVTACDVDGDGDLDLVESGVDAMNPIRIWIQYAPLSFRDEGPTRLVERRPGPALVADVDDDGDPDVWVWSSLWLNNGAGVFTESSAARVHQSSTVSQRIAAFDVDGDGDLDSLITRPRTQHIEINRHRHFAIRSMPSAGRDLILRFHADPGYATGTRTVVPLLAAGRSPVTIPGFGILQLDPQSLVLLPSVQIPPNRNAIDQRIATPRGIYGDLWCQPLFIDSAGRARLGNAAQLRF